MKAGGKARRERRLQARLLAWFAGNRRDLPWRAKPANPYHVLVSEVMLQQTQVATVIAYFQRFVAALPTVADLAAAQEQQVLRLWQGLGYYRRAKNLHAAARAIMAEHGGQVPESLEALLALPGVGRYTAGAVASIAFDRPAPILDGNVARVLARWLAIAEPIDAPAVRQRLWRMAEQLVPAEAAGDFNQAMMELGALICTPRSPACLLCPVAEDCRAHIRGLTERIPVRSARRAPRRVHHHVVALLRGEDVLLEKRGETGLWSGMWQMPTMEMLNEDMGSKDVRKWAEMHTGMKISPPARVGVFKHQTTHRTIEFAIWRAKVTGGRLKPGDRAWRRVNQVDDLPLPNPQRKALMILECEGAEEFNHEDTKARRIKKRKD